MTMMIRLKIWDTEEEVPPYPQQVPGYPGLRPHGMYYDDRDIPVVVI